jgi:surface antigen
LNGIPLALTSKEALPMLRATMPTTSGAISSWLSAAILAHLLAACAAAPAVPIAAAAGAGGGAAAGTAIGSGTGQIAAAAGGAALGGLAGLAVGQRLDRADKERAMSAERQAVTENAAVQWTGTGSTRGVVLPRRSFVDAQGRPCREFAHRIEIEGKFEEAIGVYCEDADGLWRLDGSAGAGSS